MDNERDASRTAWNAMADAYDAMAGTRADFYRTDVMGPALLSACGNMQGLAVLDLGCGQGYFSRLLAERGARVTGVDLSDGLIEHAVRREREKPLGIHYLVLDAAAVATRFPPATFDRVVSCIALQDMAHLPSVLGATKTVMRPTGHGVFLVEHPTNVCASRAWDRDDHGRKIALRLSRYFDTGRRVVTWTVPDQVGDRRSFQFPSWARTLEQWSQAFAESGFLIARLYEPRPTTQQVEHVPDLEDCSLMPYFLVFDLISDPRST